MSKKITLGVGLATSAILLAACGGISVDDIEEANDQLNNTFQSVIDTNKQFKQSEENMNTQFEEVLAQDEELASLQDESAAVVQNIDDRESLLEESSTQVDEINEQAEFLSTYEGDDLPVDTLQEISSDFQDFSNHLNDYYSRYQESLDTQRNYLNQISSEKANYEDFSTGIDTVNDDYLELQERTIELDEQLVTYNEHIETLGELIADTRDEQASGIAVQASENTDDTDSNEEETEEPASEENAEDGTEDAAQFLSVTTDPILNIPDQFPQKFVYDSGIDIEYPEEGVKGVYATAHSAGGSRMEGLTNLINSTDLNSMVVDIKDDYGNITLDLNSENELVNEMTNEIIDGEALMAQLEDDDIYPIARIVVFKDTLLAEAQPELSFTHNDGSVWSNNGGDSFVNPYLKEVWDYNIEVAIQAAKLGFKDIQFDYVRFPEGFENRADQLNYGHGHYGDDNADVINMEYRNQAVTDFVSYAKEQLQPYGADVSVDIFGYAAVVRETPGIGQSFPGISSEVDVISSMIYPSHWGVGSLGIERPDLEPYNVVDNYMNVENEIMDELGEDAPISRPWIQDFTASYLGAGYYKNYGAQEVTDQVRALADNGVHEFLLWNAGNTYSEGATYSFE